MKKNDTMGYVAYAMMLAIALIVAFVVVRPLIGGLTTSDLPMNSYLYVFILIVGSVLLNALFIELGHLFGAKAGHYTIDQWICLGLGAKRQKDGKMKFSFSDFDGLTGSTIIVPKDIKKSNPRHYIYLPLVFFLFEAVASVFMIAFGKSGHVTKGGALELAGVIVLTISGMIYLYDIFPAALDGANDGYLLTILNNQTNVEAYNELLLQQHKVAFGEKIENIQIFDHVTDFTATINSVAIYDALDKGDYARALEVNEKTILSKGKVSDTTYQEAVAQKTALYFLSKQLEEAKEFFIALPLESKKHIAGLSTIVSVRAYVLASGLAEESLGETEAALEKADHGLTKVSKDRLPIEKKLLSNCIEAIAKVHPDWDLSDYDYLKAAPKAEEAPVADKKDEDKK